MLNETLVVSHLLLASRTSNLQALLPCLQLAPRRLHCSLLLCIPFLRLLPRMAPDHQAEVDGAVRKLVAGTQEW